jgi:putative nucleotidyltransferase with HDIG domain
VVGAASAVLGGPVAQALAGRLALTSPEWLLRALAMMLVGWACGTLTRSLLARLDELEEVNDETIAAFVRAIDARDPYTAQHSQRVSLYATALAEALGLPPAEVERVRLAALLHDVGKLSMERSILQKAGPLGDEEWREMRAHPVMSAHIISGVRRFAAFRDGARHHHERYDGTGYPDGLGGEQIPRDARIIAVADAYEAMTATRAYRGAMPHAEALRRLTEGAGDQFDPQYVATFVDLEIHRRGPASVVPAASGNPAPALALTAH